MIFNFINIVPLETERLDSSYKQTAADSLT